MNDRVAITAAVLLSVFGVVRTATAQLDTPRLSAENLSVEVNSQWPGGVHGGYYPLRITIENLGETRSLTLRFQRDRRQCLPNVRRTVQVTQNSRRTYVLRIPLVGRGSLGQFDVLDEDGNVIPGLEQTIQLSDSNSSSPSRPAVLIVGETAVDARRLSRAARALELQSGSAYFGPRSRSQTPVDAGRTTANDLPRSWIDYSGLDLVFIEISEFAAVPKERRRALIHWMHCGGTLCLYKADGRDRAVANFSANLAARMAELKSRVEELLNLSEYAAIADHWEPASLGVRRSSSQTVGALYSATGRQSPPGRPREQRPEMELEYHWPESPLAFQQRGCLWGKLVIMSFNPFSGTTYDWGWFLSSLGRERYRWVDRHGFSARSDSEHFTDFLIPGVNGVPIYSFLFLITVFTVVIGPLNYFLMWKRKRLFLLVLSIPVTAILTCVALFGYSAFSHGLVVKSRIRSVTVVDQRQQVAVSHARVALFAGFPPSEGLRFSPETAVFPIWPVDREFEGGTVDWTESQQLRAGWFPPRTRTQFVAVSHRPERGRLEIKPLDKTKLAVHNGFPWTIEPLLVCDAQGRQFFARKVEAGESVTLSVASREDLRLLAERLRQNRLETPDGVVIREPGRGVFGLRRGRGTRSRWRYVARYSTSLAERKIASLQSLESDPTALRPQSYLAVLNQHPDLDLGVESPREYQAYHLLIGYY